MYVTHYTIDKDHSTIESMETNKPKVKHRYIPGHSLGGGWTRHIVELAEGDTADNPASTKGPIYGPAFVVYDCHKTGITVHVHDDASEFYGALDKSVTVNGHRFAIEVQPESGVNDPAYDEVCLTVSPNFEGIDRVLFSRTVKR